MARFPKRSFTFHIHINIWYSFIIVTCALHFPPFFIVFDCVTLMIVQEDHT
jgi:hypothetical protein